MPEFMETKEWEEWRDYDPTRKGLNIFLKPGAPEWLVKAFEEYKADYEEYERKAEGRE
jgi:hypothetical protein